MQLPPSSSVFVPSEQMSDTHPTVWCRPGTAGDGDGDRRSGVRVPDGQPAAVTATLAYRTGTLADLDVGGLSGNGMKVTTPVP